jgi:hypothetical protein
MIAVCRHSLQASIILDLQIAADTFEYTQIRGIMSVKELCEILNYPHFLPDIDTPERWQKIEAALEVSLPTDYKDFIDAFGTVYLGDFIYVLDPFTENQNFNLMGRGDAILEAFRDIGSILEGEKYPYPLYPDKDGLLPWGFTINGDHLFWFTHGEPQEWQIAIDESRGASFENYNESISSFLVKLLKKEIRSEILGENLKITYQMIK